jgi:L-ribulokinase
MQVTADVLGMDISVSSSDQSCALGSAMFAAVAAGLHPDIPAAQRAMGAPIETTYRPAAARAAAYDEIYAKYTALGAFVEKEMR